MGTKQGLWISRVAIQVAIFLFCSFIGVQGRAQERSAEEKRAEVERQKAEMERLQRIYDRDPVRYQDSLRTLWTKKYQAEAQLRLTNYKTKGVSNLEEIDLSYCQLTEIPSFVYEARALKTLILDNNTIRLLPKELNELDSLKKIYWRQNTLGQFKPKMAKLPNITKLTLDGNGLTKIFGLKRLPNLEVLELKQNKFTELPISAIRKNTKLKELSIGENPLKLSEAKYEGIAFLKILKLNKANLTGFDASLYDINGLEELQLQENNLTTLPSGISNLTQLTKFSAYKNKLTSLPADFFDLKNLTIADLYYNELEAIPAEIGQLTNLQIFYFSHNRIFSVPSEIGQLSKLRELYLHHNRLSVLPSSIGQLDSLRIVRINDNYLTEFPESLLRLNMLEQVDINNNMLSTLPEAIEQLRSLSLFTFLDNSIELNHPDNAHVPYMIERMLKRGVQCLPRIYRDETDEPANETE